ncbi:MAG: transketolase family protein [Candidatus Hydrogenedentota bacterium]
MVEKIATRETYGKVLAELGETHPEIVVLDADLSGSTKTSVFAKKFPDRFFQMGIAEANMMCVAAGLALSGKIAFVSSFALFATGRVWEQIRNTIAYSNTNVRIAASHAGVSVGADGASHQSIEDIAIMRAIPHMTVVVPADAVETEKVIRASLEWYGPMYIRLGRAKMPVIIDKDAPFELGKAYFLRRGKDATIIACGQMVYESIQAAIKLEEEGINVSVVNMSTVKPLDVESLKIAYKETGAIVTAEEHSVIGGLGSAVAEEVVRRFSCPVEMIGIKDVFGQSGEPEELFEVFSLKPRHIADAVKKVIQRKRKKV